MGGGNITANDNLQIHNIGSGMLAKNAKLL